MDEVTADARVNPGQVIDTNRRAPAGGLQTRAGWVALQVLAIWWPLGTFAIVLWKLVSEA